MAITVTSADQLAVGYRKLTVEDHGKLRFMYWKVTQGAAIGSIGSSFILGILPPGRVRALPYLSRYKGSAFGAGVLMAIGYDAYYASTQVSAIAEPALVNAFASAVDVSAATEANFPVLAGLKYDMYSRDGIQLRATFTGAVVPIGAVLEGLIAYIYE